MRARSVRILEKKMKIAERTMKRLRLIPFLEAVMVTNTIALGAPRPGSDIDLCLITRPGRLWTVRLLLILILDLRRQRPTPGRTADKICPCFFIADDRLSLERVADETPDIYLLYWLCHLTPLYDPRGVLDRVQAANQWVGEFVPRGLRPAEVNSPAGG